MKPDVPKVIPEEARRSYRASGMNHAAIAEAALAAWDRVIRTGVLFEGPYHAFVQGYLAAEEDRV